jgi:phosphotransferase system enzyme I (PtsI)
MREFKGIMISPGIAIGKAFVYIEETLAIPSYEISTGQVPYEFERFQAAVKEASEEVLQLKARTVVQVAESEGKFLDAHLLMLNDPEFTALVSRRLKEYHRNVEWVLLKVVEEMAGRLDSIGDDYLRDRSVDLHDVSQRVMDHLLYRQRVSLADLEEGSIVVAHNIMPSDAITLNRRLVAGIAMDMGGRTSHTAILARAFEIPAVLGLSDISRYVKTGDEVIVDGSRGVVIVQPDESVKKRYRSDRDAWQKRELQLLNQHELPAETLDGKRILLEANIEVPEEVESVLAHGADGIGLYRSEFLYIQPNRFPAEEEQFRAYRRVLESMKGRSVTIRTLDLGGDKVMPGFKEIAESNPILGWRAVRFCLSRPDIFKIQLRALLRSSMYGNLKIMFPMISGIEELRSIYAILDETKADLRREGIPFREDIPVGIMIEVPSAAFTSDILARSVDFFSLGTNDLIQYTIAVDRENDRIAYLYEPFHPAVLRIIKLVVDNAHGHGIPVGMCGEMAGDVSAAVVLLGLGLDELSMSAISIPEIKRIIRSVTLADAEEMVGAVMEMKSYREIDQHVQRWMEDRFDLVSY